MNKNFMSAVWRKDSQCRTCGFRELVLFADLKEADLDLIHLPISEVLFQPGGTLYRAGDNATSVFTVRSGLIKLVRYLPDGTQRIVRLLKTGSTAGLEATDTVSERTYEHTAIALQTTTVCRIPRQVIQCLMAETPRLHGRIIERWHKALEDADNGLADLSTGKAPQRLSRLLLRLTGPDGWAPLLSREDLGAMLGITTEHASRTLAELKRVGAIVELAREQCRCDLSVLETLAASGD